MDIKLEVKHLITQMSQAKVEDDDAFIVFVDRYQDVRNRLLETVNEDDVLVKALDAAYEKLSAQMSFCTMA